MIKRQELLLAARFTIREMRGRLKGFYIFIACIALGVAAIGGVSSISRNVVEEISRQSMLILGGDIKFSASQRTATAEEYQYFTDMGKVSSSVRMRSSIRAQNSDKPIMVELKAVDNLYPLYGRLKTSSMDTTDNLLAKVDNSYGAIIPQILLNRLELQLGDHIRLGGLDLKITAILQEEPDILSEGFQLAPRLLISLAALKETNLLQPGSLYSYDYKIAAAHLSDTELKTIKDTIEQRFPNTSWSVRVRNEAAAGFVKTMERFSQFLSLIGLTALLVGGVGVANSVKNYMAEKRLVIAIFKALGANSRMVMTIYFIQIMLIAAIATVIGLSFAIIMPFMTTSLLHNFLPFLNQSRIYPSSLIMAVIFSFLIVITFALVPLMQARHIPVNAIIRSRYTALPIVKQKLPLMLCLFLLCLIALIAILQSYDKKMAIIFIIFMAFSYILLQLLASFMQFCAAYFRHRGSIAWRLAIANINRKGTHTPSIVLSLGLGLTLLVILATLDGNLRRQLSDTISSSAPDFFFLDIGQQDFENFSQFIKTAAPDGALIISPILRGRITKLNGINTNEVKINPNGAWVLRKERNITYSKTMPVGTILAQGQWFAENATEPEVSIALEEAKELGLKLGDTLSVNVLGQEITAKITSLRQVNWNSFTMNFVLIFSPQALQGAPHVFLATLKDNNLTTNDEAALMRNLSKKFPAVTTISVRQVFADAQILIGQIALAMRAAASIALISSILVLAGALSAGNRAKSYDAIILKVCGATRALLIKAFIYEYAILGFTIAIFAIIAGSFAGLMVAIYQMELTNASLMLSTAFSVIIFGLVISVGLGLFGTWHILGQKPARYLKS